MTTFLKKIFLFFSLDSIKLNYRFRNIHSEKPAKFGCFYFLCSFDAREGNLSAGAGTFHDTILGPRSKLILLENVSSGSSIPSNRIPGVTKGSRIPVYPGWLEIRNLRRRDSGPYTCRAEFEDAPTQTHHIRLTVYGKDQRSFENESRILLYSFDREIKS